jgi:hypothetical protein
MNDKAEVGKQDVSLLASVCWHIATLILALFIMYNLHLNSVFTSQQKEIQQFVSSFIASDEAEQELTLYSIFYGRVVSLSKEDHQLVVDLGNDVNFNRHCFDTTFRVIKLSTDGTDNRAKKAELNCGIYSGSSIYKVSI